MKGWHVIQIAAVFGTAMLLASCGQPGAPQPPALELPKAATDVTATRKGDRVTIRWMPPERFTDGRILRQAGPTNICRTAGSILAATCTAVATLPPPSKVPKGQMPPRVQAQYEDVLGENVLQTSATGKVMYGVEVLNTHARSVGISNQVEISTAPALPPPTRLAASVGERGVTVTWASVAAPNVPGIEFAYRISRRGETGDFSEVATVPIDQTNYVDQAIEWEKKFTYRIAVLTESASDRKVLVEGDDSEVVSGFAHDIFPPAPPRELQAVFSGPGQQPFIDLSWAPNLEPDLAGYNVYRHEEGAPAVKLNSQLVTSPSFRDEHIEAGKTYFYSVSALDVRGNESAYSTETSESVPK